MICEIKNNVTTHCIMEMLGLALIILLVQGNLFRDNEKYCTRQKNLGLAH